MSSTARRQARRAAWMVLSLLATGPASTAVLAQVVPGGLGTRVNGTALGRCAAGVCSVRGGTTVGRTLYHRFAQFDTRQGIRRVDLDTRGRSSVVVGVSHPDGTFFGAPLRISGAASLFWLSPGGLWLGTGGQILGATNLLLSTAPTLRFPGGEFAALGGPGEPSGRLRDVSSLDVQTLFSGTGTGTGPIVLAGGRLQVDRHLLLDSGAGPIVSLPGPRQEVRAGGDVVLQGGDLLLQRLDVQAGTATAVGQGRLDLADSDLRAPRLLLEGATVRLDTVRLEGGDVQVRAREALTASGLRAMATERLGGRGWLDLAAGAGREGASGLRLERSELEGASVVVRAAGPVDLQEVRLKGGDLWLGTLPGPGGIAPPLRLDNASLDGGALSMAASGDLWARGLRASGLRASGEGGAIQLAARRLEVESSRLSADTIVGRADQAIRLRGVTLQAGDPGRRGLVQLETAPAPEAPDGPGPGISGAIQLTDTRIEGQRVAVRGGTIGLASSRIDAPKGQIHLEAKAGDLEVSASTLDLTARTMADLRAPVNIREDASGAAVDLGFPTPSLGLFSAANIQIRAGSSLIGSQDLSPLLTGHLGWQREDIRLTDTSGIVIVDADFGLTIANSSIAADASHNLAGNVLLRSRSLDGAGTLTVRDASLSASGGAGSGDIRLTSANGLLLERSRLAAQSTRSPEDPGTLISGGEITLTNSSGREPIILRQSRVLAEQSGGGGSLPITVLDGSDTALGAMTFQDLYDDNDRDSIGGIITLVSAGGLRLEGPTTRVSVDSAPPSGGPLDSLGGTLRIVNLGRDPILLEAADPFHFRSAPPADARALWRTGELLLVRSGDPPPSLARLWGQDRLPNPYLFQPGMESEDAVFAGGIDAYPVGLPQEIRERVLARRPDVVLSVGAVPRAIDLPSSQRQPQPPGDTPATAARTAVHGRPLPWRFWEPAASGGVPALPSLTLTASNSPASGLAASGAASSQALPPEAAERSLQGTDQAAAQRVSAALGLASPAVPTLQVSALQTLLRNAIRTAPALRPDPQPYRPAILQISAAPLPGTDQLQINHILIPATGAIQGWQTRVAREPFRRRVEAFQRQLSQDDGPGVREPGASLSAVLLAPVLPELGRQGVNALLLALDRGLQGVPFAALPVGDAMLIDRVALTVTPTLAFLQGRSREPVGPGPGPRALLAGSSRFAHGLAPLPMAAQELRQVASLHPDALILLDSAFSAEAILRQMETRAIGILHLATHADFSSHSPEKGRVYTHAGELSLARLGRELRRAGREPLDLFVLNGCRTAVGDEDQELGISGLALQANARSALGNLWYVDDVVTAAFSVQFHRALQQGLRKDEALRQTQRLFRQGGVAVRGDAMINEQGDVLISGLSRADQLRLRARLRDPYYWAGAILSGSPW
ncbi:MAG: CHAT domain-containing protein [Cyanobacteriota bacterium]|nr:CHAT domain-containing protein [Cyanobacteriota bacterium]